MRLLVAKERRISARFNGGFWSGKVGNMTDILSVNCMVLYARLRFRALGFVSWVEYTPMAGNKPRETFSSRNVKIVAPKPPIARRTTALALSYFPGRDADMLRSQLNYSDSHPGSGRARNR